MESVISSERIPIKLWLDDMEEGALEQAKNLANLPFAYKHVAIMPDSHQGYGMPIGGVLATKGVVIPNAVGVDIGCGMCAVKTNIQITDKEKIKEIIGLTRKVIPVGFKSHPEKQDHNYMPDLCIGGDDKSIVARQYEKARTQVGTLGGGNHFIELQEDEEGYLWIMIHSGSRNLGYTVAGYYNNAAIDINERYYSVVDKKQELAFFPLDSELAQQYIKEMKYCTDFALSNRQLMMQRVLECVDEVMGSFDTEPMINKPHNFAEMENHFGENVIVHRKGACRVREGDVGMIPGSQGSNSYIVEGLGNRDSFHSCSHGAGRKMSRKKARAELDLQTQIDKLNEQGIVHGLRHKKNLDEAPDAYKDIDIVMSRQQDLVNVLHTLYPLGVMKG